jgi:hypothetical protein
MSSALETVRENIQAHGFCGLDDPTCAQINTGQTADLPHTTVTLFRGSSGSRFDQTTSFTYERVLQLPQRLTDALAGAHGGVPALNLGSRAAVSIISSV